MDAFPVQKELIDAVIGFANAELDDPAEVRDYFKGTWAPDDAPRLRACRNLQADVRSWLFFAAEYGDRECYTAIRGLQDKYDGTFAEIDPGIRLEGKIGVEKTPVMGGHEERIVWTWSVSRASLRSICGLAMATIIQEGLHWKIGECDRDGCDNIFLDRKSRGKRRKYCGSEQCERIRTKERVAAIRKNRKPEQVA